jgi:hypothetical protein
LGGSEAETSKCCCRERCFVQKKHPQWAGESWLASKQKWGFNMLSPTEVGMYPPRLDVLCLGVAQKLH